MKEVVMSEQEIQNVCASLGQQLTKELKDEAKLPLFLCVLQGALEFYADLVKRVDLPILQDFIEMKSYDGLGTTGQVKITRDLTTNIDGRTVVVVDDAVDTGLTMEALVEHLKKSGHAKRIIICPLFDKRDKRRSSVKVDLCGKVILENKFLMGYGFDYKGIKRNVPFVYVPDDKDIKSMQEILAKRG
jgi:hypoxanthine phosphoribosyltransferase